MADNYRNLATVELDNNLTASATSLVIGAEKAGVMPEVPFYATLMPVNAVANNKNSEIIYATAKTDSAGEVEVLGNAGQATYSGKNLLGNTLEGLKAINTDGTWNGDVYNYGGVSFSPIFVNGLLERVEVSGVATANVLFYVERLSKAEFEAIVPSGTSCTLSGCPSGGSALTYYLRVFANPWQNVITDTGNSTTGAITVNSNVQTIALAIGVDNGVNMAGESYYPMLEKGSKTNYEPYVGGTSSPNPEYPQNVNIATGVMEMTTELGSVLSLDLGTVELCKVGSYQDRIYKSGDDWMLEKAIGKVVFDGSETWNTSGAVVATGVKAFLTPNAEFVSFKNGLCNAFMVRDTAGWGTQTSAGNACLTSGNMYIRIAESTASTVDELKNWLASNNVVLYYPLSTATSTTITDANLIAELEALVGAGEVVEITATGSNLAVDIDQISLAMSEYTIERGMRETSPKDFGVDDIMSNAIYVDDAVLLGEDNFPTENVSPWIGIDDIDFDKMPDMVVVNSYLTTLQSTTSNTGVNVNVLQDGTNLGSLKITLPRAMPVMVMGSFPISASSGNAYIGMNIDGVFKANLCTSSETTSHETMGILKTATLSAGEHTFTFQLRSGVSGQTAYIGASRSISLALIPLAFAK